MRSVLSSLFLTITCALPLGAQVIQYEIDPSFNSGALLKRGSVQNMCIHDDGTILVAGMFNLWDSPAENISLFSANGSLISPVGGGFFPRVEKYRSGYIVIGPNSIGRINLPDQPAPTFQYEWGKSAYNAAPSRMAHNILIMPDDNIIVAGRFHTDSILVGTAEAHLGLRQLSMLDSTGAPVPDFPMISCAQPVNSAYIRSVKKLSTGEYLVSGMFNEIEGHPYAKLAKLNPDFSVNTDFIPVFETTGTGVDIKLIDSQDRIWLGFGSNIALLDYPDYASRLVRLLPDGSLDEGFDPPVFSGYLSGSYENPTDPVQASVVAVTEDEDGTFILSGQFTEINGDHYRRLAKITDSGELIPEAMQSLGPDSSAWGPPWEGSFGPVMSAMIVSVNKLPGGKLMIGGEFSSFGGEPYSCLVRLQPAGFVSTDDSDKRGVLKIYPNPARRHFRIEMPEGVEPLQTVELLDIQGRILRTWRVAQGSYPLDGLPAGPYVVRASGKERAYAQKIVLDP
jgi:hypothetical protein